MDIERGDAKYFHGRERQLNSFKNLLSKTVKNGMGSSVLIQGAPGIGKSALIDVYEKHAKTKGWHTVELNTESLYNPKELFRRLSQNKNAQELETTFGLDLKVFKVGFIPKSSEETKVLNESMIRSQPTLLVLDEAQTLEDLLLHQNKNKITTFLNTFHNFKSQKGFILLLGGLSTTKEILRQFGISRFNPQCVQYLSHLEPNAERQIIDDWLKKEIQTPSDTMLWIHAITKRTHGWPRHVISYCHAICNLLKVQEPLTSQKLKAVLAYGDELKAVYYEQRCNGIDYEIRQLIASTIDQLPQWFFKKEVIKQFLKEFSIEESEKLYQTILSKGIIEVNRKGLYSVPIPSLRSFLIREYGPVIKQDSSLG